MQLHSALVSRATQLEKGPHGLGLQGSNWLVAGKLQAMEDIEKDRGGESFRLLQTYYGLKSILFLIGLKVLPPLGLRCTISSHTPLSLASRDLMNTPHFLLTLPLSMAWTWTIIKINDNNTTPHSPCTAPCTGSSHSPATRNSSHHM